MRPIATSLSRAGVLASLFLAAACGDWPDLATVPAAEPLSPRSPVRLPAAMRATAPFDAEAAAQALELLPKRLDHLEIRISGQRSQYLQALRAAESAPRGERAEARRSAQLELSRLSALETELSRLRDDLERLRLSPLTSVAQTDLARLRAEVESLQEGLSVFLAAERQRLVRLSDAHGS